MSVRVVDLLDHTRNELLRDVASPYMFSHEALLVYLNEGYRQFARTTHCFVDDETTINTEKDVAHYVLPENTVHLRSVAVGDRHLRQYTRKSKVHLQWSGRPCAYTTDTSQSKIRLYPVPDDIYVASLERAVLPPILRDSSTVLLDFEFAYLLPQWITYRALLSNDPDGSNTVSAKNFFTDWTMGLKSAKLHFVRKAMGDEPSAQPRRWT